MGKKKKKQKKLENPRSSLPSLPRPKPDEQYVGGGLSAAPAIFLLIILLFFL